MTLNNERLHSRQFEGQYYDVAVLGGGMAGLFAARQAAKENPKARVLVVIHGDQGTSGCSHKTHGVNAAMNPGDTREQHYLDTLAGGGYINNRELAWTLCQEAPDRIRDLEAMGVTFNKASDGTFHTGYYGGSTTGRSIHSRDMAGMRIVFSLIQECIIFGCEVKQQHSALSLIMDDGKCRGALVADLKTGELAVIYAKATILATGGGACVYPIATISDDKVAAGMTMAYHAGAELVDMEMVQFHPTGLVAPGTPGHGEILEEELRSMGGKLLNRAGDRFMFGYDQRGERATRDIVARSSYLEILAGRGTDRGGVYFDLTEVKKAHNLLERFPFMVQRLRAYGMDLQRDDVVEISPTAHFLMGGVRINANAESEIPGLFACGEDAGGIHGGNRLGGNGIADTLVFGFRAGTHAARYAARTPTNTSITSSALPVEYYDATAEDVLDADRHLRAVMWAKSGLVRSGESLIEARRTLDELTQRLSSFRCTLLPGRDQCTPPILKGVIFRQRLELAQIIVAAAMTRRNSVGAHFRADSDQSTTLFNTIISKGPDNKPIVRTIPIVEGAVDLKMPAPNNSEFPTHATEARA